MTYRASLFAKKNNQINIEDFFRTTTHGLNVEDGMRNVYYSLLAKSYYLLLTFNDARSIRSCSCTRGVFIFRSNQNNRFFTLFNLY